MSHLFCLQPVPAGQGEPVTLTESVSIETLETAPASVMSVSAFIFYNNNNKISLLINPWDLS